MTDETKALATVQRALTDSEFDQHHKDLAKFVNKQLKEAKNIANGDSGDYGIIPYTKKKSLLKPGAEKLLKLFGLTAKNELIKEVEDFPGGFVYYKYRCTIIHGPTGSFMADATRSCNNKEKKHAGKSVYDAANTCEAIAQKRALVAATIQATMASEIFDAAAESGEYDEEAPNKSTTKAEDPHRNQLMSRLYGTASRHGWTDAWIHKAIEKKWGVTSLTETSNAQIEELEEFIVTKYKEVGKGSKPELREPVQKPGAAAPVEGEVVNEEAAPVVPADYICKGLKHNDQPESEKPKVAIGEFCSDECRDSYYPPKPKPKYQFTKKES